MSDLGRSLSVAAGDIENNQPPPRAGNPAPARPGGVRTCASAPHSAVQFGTRVVVDGQAGHYVNFRLPAFSRIEHVVCFDDGGEQTLRGDRCHFFRVVLKHILPSIARQPAQGWTVAQDPDGGGTVTVSTITNPDGAVEISVTSQTTLADFRRSIEEELGIPAEEQRLLLSGTERIVAGPAGRSNSPFLWQLEESVLPGMRVLVVVDSEHQQEQQQQHQEQLPFEAAFRSKGAAATDDDGALEPPLGWDWQLGFVGLSAMMLVFAAVVLVTLRSLFWSPYGLRSLFWSLLVTVFCQCCLLRGWHTTREKGTPRALAPKHASGGIDLASLGQHGAAVVIIKPSGKRFLAIRGWEVAPHTVRGWTMNDQDDMTRGERGTTASVCVALFYAVAWVGVFGLVFVVVYNLLYYLLY